MISHPNLDLVNINTYAKLYQTLSIHSDKILSRKEILTITKGHNCVIYLQKLMRNNPNLDLVKINVYAKFGLSINPSSRYWAERKFWLSKGHNCVVYLRKLMHNYPNIDLIVQCICKIWSNSIYSVSRYWVEMKIWW